MHVKSALLLLVPAVALVTAGCLDSASPLGDAEAAHAGASCDVGMFVTGFTPEGAPRCAAPETMPGDTCAAGEVMVGLGANGTIQCAPIMDVAQEAAAQARPPPQQPAKSLALSSAGALVDGEKSYVVASASPNMTWGSIGVTINGQPLRLASGCEPAEGEYAACAGERPESTDATLDAGDTLTIRGTSGATMRIIDATSNSVILTLVVG